jgi:molybdenum-dependent DNA-binding transcriptional regulator ModE
MRLFELSTTEATAIRNSLDKYKLKQWGFVIFRCTYKSQEKWDQFIGLVKEHAHDYFEWRGMEDVYDRMAWTIVEDAEALEGASLVTTARRFVEWVEGPEGRQDREGSVFDTDAFPVYGPRYTFFLHADEESLESVVDDAKAREDGGYFCMVARAKMILAAERERQEEGDEHAEEQEDEEEELLDLRKRVKIDKLVLLYALVLDTNTWYNIYVEDGVVEI